MVANPSGIPICSMYGICTYICPNNDPNVGEYTIHGAYGIDLLLFVLQAVFSLSPIYSNVPSLSGRMMRMGFCLSWRTITISNSGPQISNTMWWIVQCSRPVLCLNCFEWFVSYSVSASGCTLNFLSLVQHSACKYIKGNMPCHHWGPWNRHESLNICFGSS